MTQTTTEAIAKRAYELYLERGRQDGHDLEDWLRAERELTLSNAKAAPVLKSAPKLSRIGRA